MNDSGTPRRSGRKLADQVLPAAATQVSERERRATLPEPQLHLQRPKEPGRPVTQTVEVWPVALAFTSMERLPLFAGAREWAPTTVEDRAGPLPEGVGALVDPSDEGPSPLAAEALRAAGTGIAE